MWNCLDLQCPASDMCDYPPQDSYLIEELRDFVTVLTTSADILTLEQPLFNEMQVFHNIQTKYRRILHCDKCLVYLARVGHCMKKMIMLNLSKSYIDLAERFLIGFQNAPSIVSLPSRQQVEYILIRTQGAAKIVCEGIKYSRETFCFLIKKLKIGHIILDLVMATSVTARVNILLKTIAVQLCAMYQKILVWRYKLKQGSHKWTEKVTLPLDLEKWLQASESEFTKSLPMTQSDVEFVRSILRPNTEDRESESDSVIFVDEEDEISLICEKSVNKMNDTDYGEIVPRKKTTKELSEKPIALCSKGMSRKSAKKLKPLTPLQKKFLSKLVQAQTFKKLAIMWKKSSSKNYPKPLSADKRKIVSTFLSAVKGNQSAKNSESGEISESDASIAGMMLARHLGFSQIQIDDCRCASGMHSSDANSVALEPVKTLKKLKSLYQHVCQNLLSANRSKRCKKLENIFKSRIADIRLLKKNGENDTARKLIFCTSKVILTLYNK